MLILLQLGHFFTKEFINMFDIFIFKKFLKCNSFGLRSRSSLFFLEFSGKLCLIACCDCVGRQTLFMETWMLQISCFLAYCYSSLGPMSSVQFVISLRHFCILLILFYTNACKANCTCRREFTLEKPSSLLCVLSSLCDIVRPFSETRLFQIIFTFYIAG